MTKVNDIILGAFIAVLFVGGFLMARDIGRMDKEIQKLETQKIELQIHIQKLQDLINEEETEVLI